MSYRWMKVDLREIHLVDLIRSEIVAFLVLAYNQSEEGIVVMSYSELAGRCGISKRQAINAVRGLEEKGLVLRIGRGGVLGALVVEIKRGASVGKEGEEKRENES